MDKREDALREALQKNEEESLRWENYLKENETAIENMSLFSKCLTVDVMVPVGKKAYMPGHLLHTNEVLVGHYQGYFSKCSTFKAKEVCELRIKMAKEHLKKLETEAEFWQNKLDKPYAEGVMPRAAEREIIEEYNEENEKLWKEKHRIRVRQTKQKEREEREKNLQKQQKENTNDRFASDGKHNDEIFKMLDEAELMEELEQELDNLEFDDVNDETIRKLMSGEIKLPPEKKRKTLEKKTSYDQTTKAAILLPNIVKKNDIKEESIIRTNNNVQPNPIITRLAESQEENGIEMEEEPLPEEVELIKEQAKFLNVEDQIGFYEYQIEIIRQKLNILPLKSQKELNEKIHLLNVLEHLEELLEEAEETVGTTELAEKDLESEAEIPAIISKENKDLFAEKTEKEGKTGNTNKVNQTRRISFALEDTTVEFREHEAVAQMLPLQRDIIRLDNQNDEEANITKIELPSKNDSILAKVEKNLQFVEESQSKQDFDLVEKILQSSMEKIKTLHIKFKHSQQEGYAKDNKKSYDVPGCPADIYDLYVQTHMPVENKTEPSTLFINSYEGEDQVKTPVLKESDRQAAYADPKAKYSNPSLQAKSILKNKSAVDKENHSINHGNRKVKKKSSKKEEDECLSAYCKVMNEVVEKPLTQPEPLPEVKFIDAHAPKKRISRFKQMRQETEKT